jgi:hypothetical protein
LDKDKIRRKRDQFPCISAHALGGTLGEAIIYSKVAAFLPAKFLQPVQKCSVAGSLLWIVLSKDNERADAPHPLRLLSARGERPHHHRSADKTEKFPPPHIRPSAQEAASYRFN